MNSPISDSRAAGASRSVARRSRPNHAARRFATMTWWLVAATAAGVAPEARAVIIGPNVNITKSKTTQAEAAIAINPVGPSLLFAASVDYSTGSPRNVGMRSSDGGATWTAPVLLGTGTDGLAAAKGDPSVAYDRFGNLYVTYVDNSANKEIIVGRSTDNGATWTQIGNFGKGDQPTIVAGPSSAAAKGDVWLTWQRSSDSAIVAAGATATALGATGAFSAVQDAPGSAAAFGNFGDIAIGAGGKAIVAWQSAGSGQGPDTVRVNVDANGIGGAAFAAAVNAATTNVGAQDSIPAQPTRNIGAEASLAWNRATDRLWMVYTDEFGNESNDTDIWIKHSDDNGATWQGTTLISTLALTSSQFMPKMAIDPITGNLVVVWHDARSDNGAGGGGQRTAGANNEAELWGTMSLDGGATFLPNFKISTGM
ncbi:MAG: exo-alpha-sialidase [Planctomycetia bacterium]|nr:exo-alpha-sialidase [Planctomycetia bacterium]